MDDNISMEEVRRRLAGQGSGDSHSLAIEEEMERVGIVTDDSTKVKSCGSKREKLKPLGDALAALAENKADNQSQTDDKPKIQKIPFMLQDNENFKKYYEPRVVSVGPIHHGNPKFKLSEKLKINLAANFIKENGLDKEILYDRIMEVIEDLKECYEEKTIGPYNNDDLVLMFLVDGCAALHYIYCAVSKDADEKLKALRIKNDHVAFAAQDLFLMENQLPFRVLELLINSCLAEKAKELRTSIEEFIQNNTIAPYAEPMDQPQTDKNPEPPAHLLELLRRRLVYAAPQKKKNCIEWLLSLCANSDQDSSQPKYSFRNIQELQAAGILLWPKKGSSLTEISFKRICFIGNLSIPPFVVDDSTAPKLMNLIAYEMCPDFQNEFGVTSYVCLLDSLIDEAVDVQALRNAGILLNSLGSDKEVAKLFNEITTDLVPNPNKYSKIKDRIQKHCDYKLTSWIAQAYNTHFSSPWTVLAFVGATAALVMTFIQTWYTMKADDPSNNVCNNVTTT